MLMFLAVDGQVTFQECNSQDSCDFLSVDVFTNQLMICKKWKWLQLLKLDTMFPNLPVFKTFMKF